MWPPITMYYGARGDIRGCYQLQINNTLFLCLIAKTTLHLQLERSPLCLLIPQGHHHTLSSLYHTNCNQSPILFHILTPTFAATTEKMMKSLLLSIALLISTQQQCFGFAPASVSHASLRTTSKEVSSLNMVAPNLNMFANLFGVRFCVLVCLYIILISNTSYVLL